MTKTKITPLYERLSRDDDMTNRRKAKLFFWHPYMKRSSFSKLVYFRIR